MKKSFVISEVSREDLEAIGFDTSEVLDETMEYLAKRLGVNYYGQLFWSSLKITAEYLDIPKKESQEVLEWDEENKKINLEF